MNNDMFEGLLDKVVIRWDDDEGEHVVEPAEEGNPELDELCWAMERYIENLEPYLEQSVLISESVRNMVLEEPTPEMVHYRVSDTVPITEYELELIRRLNNMRANLGLSRLITIPTANWEDKDNGREDDS